MTVRLHIQVEKVIGEINITLRNDHSQIDSRILRKYVNIGEKFLKARQDGTLMRPMAVYEGHGEQK